MTFGEKLQTLRKGRGLSQEQLAEALAVSRQAISKWELNASMPDAEKIVELSRLFSVSTDYLLKEEPERQTADAAAEELRQIKEELRTLSGRKRHGLRFFKIWNRLWETWKASSSGRQLAGVAALIGAAGAILIWLCYALSGTEYFFGWAGREGEWLTGFLGFLYTNRIFYWFLALIGTGLGGVMLWLYLDE